MMSIKRIHHHARELPAVFDAAIAEDVRPVRVSAHG